MIEVRWTEKKTWMKCHGKPSCGNIFHWVGVFNLEGSDYLAFMCGSGKCHAVVLTGARKEDEHGH